MRLDDHLILGLKESGLPGSQEIYDWTGPIAG